MKDAKASLPWAEGLPRSQCPCHLWVPGVGASEVPVGRALRSALLGVLRASPCLVITCSGGDLASSPNCQLPEGNGLSHRPFAPSVQHGLGTLKDVNPCVYSRKRWQHDSGQVPRNRLERRAPSLLPSCAPGNATPHVSAPPPLATTQPLQEPLTSTWVRLTTAGCWSPSAERGEWLGSAPA